MVKVFVRLDHASSGDFVAVWGEIRDALELGVSFEDARQVEPLIQGGNEYVMNRAVEGGAISRLFYGAKRWREDWPAAHFSVKKVTGHCGDDDASTVVAIATSVAVSGPVTAVGEVQMENNDVRPGWQLSAYTAEFVIEPEAEVPRPLP